MQVQNRITRLVLSTIGKDNIEKLDEYVLVAQQRPYIDIKSNEQINEIFGNSVIDFLSNLTQEDLMTIRTYTGYDFKRINAVLRSNWNYEEHGRLTEELKQQYLRLSQDIDILFNKFATPNIDFITYRGVELSSFKKYGINSLEELENLNGKYLYEEGFTSTSLIRDTSYIGKTLENGKSYNVGIKYLISSESQDGALLIDDNLSYSPSQNEYIINKGSLIKVTEVNIDKENNQAYILAQLIPKKMWNLVGKKEEISQTK